MMPFLNHRGVRLDISEAEDAAVQRLREAVLAAGYPSDRAVSVALADLEAWEDIAQRYERLGVPCAYANEHGIMFKGCALQAVAA